MEIEMTEAEKMLAAAILNAADKIGVARKWIQKAGTHQEHFDIAKSKRALAVQLGAVEIGREGLVEILRKRRASKEGA
ncbi:DUF4031 domain-containing protein [Cupriavidus sp. UYPR2.512]|uniref:DUF4031 domain-containing protein n=1 Tax=Cupriavidus sp. UYPR2.512 TaxID=1080187 RepID=UPI0006845ABA|nr:DUF4031 domain-containing protein [Cupriavidus sp. UYPR2.512]UIF90873.1 DUF4031 domain-containing protein [Cupriavidus necator]